MDNDEGIEFTAFKGLGRIFAYINNSNYSNIPCHTALWDRWTL